MAREVRWGPLLVFELAFWVGLTGWGTSLLLPEHTRFWVFVAGGAVWMALLPVAALTAPSLRGLPARFGGISEWAWLRGQIVVMASVNLAAVWMAPVLAVFAMATVVRSRVAGVLESWWVTDDDVVFDHDRLPRHGIAYVRADLPRSKAHITLLDGTELRAGRPDRLDLLWRIAQVQLAPDEHLGDVASVQTVDGSEVLVWRAANVGVGSSSWWASILHCRGGQSR